MKYYLGIDGGGTKTVVAVSDENGSYLFTKTGKTINFYSVGMENARKNLAQVIAEVEETADVTEFEAVFIGCSALDCEADDELVEKLCGGIINAKKIKMDSDVYIALRSAGDVPCPCVAICGTGSMAIARDKKGEIHISGGWGHVIGDEGSGYSIAINAIKLCCRQCDKGEESALLKSAAEFFDVDDFRKAIDIIYSKDTTKDILAGFASCVGSLADSGDSDAFSIVCNEAESFAQTVLILTEKIKCCGVLGLYGGVFVHNTTFRNSFENRIKEKYPDLEIKLIDMPPEKSALILAREI